tara:strand:+ start:200 stop:1324 length:1125 start_codon:yes stop_codon:yes gene_type:complete
MYSVAYKTIAHMNKICILLLFTISVGKNLDQAFQIAGKNHLEIKRAIKIVPEDQFEGMKWLITHMPNEDLKTLSAEFLISNCELAYQARRSTIWGEKISDEVFYNYVLPYANLNEKVEDWRLDFYNKFYPMVKDLESAYEAVVVLNHKIYEELGVIYSTSRPKADQSPYESIDAGMASCTGLSILLIDVCRSVGIPARFVGTPSWYNNSGNHSWIEAWDDGWHFTGAAEPTDQKLNESWFQDLASEAIQGNNKYGVFAATWEETDIHFPMDWLPEVKIYNAIDVTQRYKNNLANDNLIPIRVRALDSSGNRQEVKVVIYGKNNYSKEGISKDETCDANDHLTFMLPKGEIFKLQSKTETKMIEVDREKIIDLKL